MWTTLPRAELDAFATVKVLSEAIKKAGDFDLVLCGRQASDWDNAHVPMGVAEALGLPCITLAQKVDVQNGTVNVHRSLSDGYEVVEADTPALVTVSNELGRGAVPYAARHHGRLAKEPGGLVDG